MVAMTLEAFCNRFQGILDQEKDLPNRLQLGRELMSELTHHVDWFRGCLGRLLFDKEFLAMQKPSIWPNEITLYRSPDQSFVIFAYIWEAYLKDVIHDHGSWGIIGSFIQSIHETKHERLDDGKIEGFAELKEASSREIEQGDTTCVLPLNNGIHRMENRTNAIAVTVNVYGKTIRRGYIQFYYPENKTVLRVFPPKTFKQVLAVRALCAMDATSLLKEALEKPLPDYIRKECELSLARTDEERR
jgi:predicted metal-dependent enzyme (double-stranded beta helix superfamily)